MRLPSNVMNIVRRQAPRRSLDFAILGGTKTGTTSFYRWLMKHWEVALPREKEPHYFSQGLFDSRYRAIAPETADPDAYWRLFGRQSNAKLRADCDPLTLHGPRAPELMREQTVDPRFVVLIRNPIERAFSHYLMDIREGFDTREFLNAINEDYATFCRDPRAYCPIIRLGFFAESIMSFCQMFGSSTVRIWLYDDLCSRPEETMREICAHARIGYNPSIPFSATRENEAGRARSALSLALLRARWGALHKPRRLYLRLPWSFRQALRRLVLVRRVAAARMAPESWQRLEEIYRPEIGRLSEITGRDLSYWLERPDDAGV